VFRRDCRRPRQRSIFLCRSGREGFQDAPWHQLLEKWPQLINFQSEAILQLWLDPQTCGPLLAAIPAAQAKACLTAMQTNGFPHARQIAMVMG
ncbi:MAG: hypothetical protein EBU13_10470, partial [Synechococcaceae bacterium WB5_2A_257]|nr:hypothetical protein [Synechococcaceae bacterium WB5_2A_257]